MSKLTIGCSPITSEIFAGKLNKNKTMWKGEKIDVTDTAVGAVAQHLLQKDEEMQFNYKDKRYALRVVELKNEK